MQKILQEIEVSNQWRAEELRKLRLISESLKENIDLQKIFLKSIIPLVYAHWEGMVISTFEIIIEDLNSKKISILSAHINIVSHAYEKNFDSMKNATDFLKKCKNLESLLLLLNENLSFESKKINVKSNLKFAVLTEICQKFLLNIDSFQSEKAKLDRFVNIRNSIAHGENSISFEKFDDIKEYIDLIFQLFEILKMEIEIFYKEEKYLRIIS